jgi:hypothetical protein
LGGNSCDCGFYFRFTGDSKYKGNYTEFKELELPAMIIV